MHILSLPHPRKREGWRMKRRRHTIRREPCTIYYFCNLGRRGIGGKRGTKRAKVSSWRNHETEREAIPARNGYKGEEEPIAGQGMPC